MIRFLVDECVQRSVVERLRAEGHDVAWIVEDSPGLADPGILQRSRAEGRVVVTLDRGLGTLAWRTLDRRHPGVIVLRPATPALGGRLDAAMIAIGDPGGCLVILGPSRIRRIRLGR